MTKNFLLDVLNNKDLLTYRLGLIRLIDFQKFMNETCPYDPIPSSDGTQ